MAEADDKTIAPTQPRRDDARREGRVAQSHDLAAAALLIVGLLALSMLGQRVVEFFCQVTQQHLSGETWSAVVANSSSTGSEPFDAAVDRGQSLLMQIVAVMAPLLGVLLAAAIVVNLGQTGFRWLPERVVPDLSRLSPLAGLRRVFSIGGGERLLMGVLKMGCVLLVAYLSLWQRREAIVNAAALDVPQLAVFILEITYWTCLKIAISLLVLAIADYGYQRWKLERDLQMSPEELREEMRNQQGDPQLLTRRRAVQRQQNVDLVMAAVAQSNLVIAAGSRLAVAIRYDPATMPEPVVVSKGTGEVAESICRTANKRGVPIVQGQSLAEGLYRQIGFNQPILDQWYDPVAKLLADLYELRGQSLTRRAA